MLLIKNIPIRQINAAERGGTGDSIIEIRRIFKLKVGKSHYLEFRRYQNNLRMRGRYCKEACRFPAGSYCKRWPPPHLRARFSLRMNHLRRITLGIASSDWAAYP